MLLINLGGGGEIRVLQTPCRLRVSFRPKTNSLRHTQPFRISHESASRHFLSSRKIYSLCSVFCGGGEIRTLEGCNTLPPFQGGALDHYATPPYASCYTIGCFYFPSSALILSSTGGCVENKCAAQFPAPATFAPNGSPMKRWAVARCAFLIGAP